MRFLDITGVGVERGFSFGCVPCISVKDIRQEPQCREMGRLVICTDEFECVCKATA